VLVKLALQLINDASQLAAFLANFRLRMTERSFGDATPPHPVRDATVVLATPFRSRMIEEPEMCRRLLKRYFEAQDTIKRLIETCCDFGSDYTMLTEDLYAAFKAWCVRRVGGRWLPMNKFAEKLGLLDELGIEKWRDPRTDRRGFRGLRLSQTQGDIF